ncbi:SGNH/GDSL hydrolase family protein [Actinomadura sp. HBU206391]|uniref:SGNH/GDSL hydrolase family protein n=1 Tax=Actinomadura sp. HBU206391 TaxID=2731692 RepID=UPI00164F6DA5|nr:SGNH/GDSL hydrolase family protein [Actinomadura sp. HBU206391]MBC6460361.1 SGNH/GDSL hydrolase family protein [Actinomadura sp. HBU206391]
MRRLVPYALAAVLTMSGCTAVASQSPQRAGKATRATGDKALGGKRSAGGERGATAPVVMILGDSYTAGIPGTPPTATYAADVARTLGWQIIIAGYRGTGFVAPGRIGKTFPMLFDEELAWRPAPDMVIVAGGHNDWPHDPQLVTASARQLLTKIRQQWPSTRLLLTGPMWGGDPRREALRVRDALKGVASELQVPFIDPLQEKWITGNVRRRTGTARTYIRRDGVHPNAAGNRYFADRFVTDLRRLGLDEPRLPAGGDDHQGP